MPAVDLDEQIAEQRRQLVLLLAQVNRDRELVVTAREQLGQLEQWLRTLERGIQEKDRAVAEINAELAHLERLRVERARPTPAAAPAPAPSPPKPLVTSGPPPVAPVAVNPPAEPVRVEPPVAAPAPPVFAAPSAPPPPVAAPPPAAQPPPPARSSAVEETREFVRKSVCARVEMEGDTNFYVGFSQNISEGGLFIATYDTMPVGSQFRLNFTLPTHPHPIAAVVEVMWVREYADGADLDGGTLPGMGVRFLKIGTEQRQAITRFTEKREPMFLPID